MQTLAALRAAEEQVRLQTAEAEAARKAAKDETDKLQQVGVYLVCQPHVWLDGTLSLTGMHCAEGPVRTCGGVCVGVVVVRDRDGERSSPLPASPLRAYGGGVGV
jgi:hypothetical protein